MKDFSFLFDFFSVNIGSARICLVVFSVVLELGFYILYLYIGQALDLEVVAHVFFYYLYSIRMEIS